MGNNGETVNHDKIWENFILPKGCHVEKQLSCNPIIFFVITGSVCFKMHDAEETHTVFSREMLMAQIDNSFEIVVLEQTHLIVCHIPMETWYAEQKWIESLASKVKNHSDGFFKLPVNKVIIRYLSLLDLYFKEGILSEQFLDLERRELFFLLFYYYSSSDLAQFFQCIISKDMQFKKLVVTNYLQARNVQDLAKLANYSTSGFIKKFQRCFNDSPYKWMQKQKAKQISTEIYEGTKSLQEIANEYNFSSYQHFSVFCKAQFGVPPTVIWGKIRLKSES